MLTELRVRNLALIAAAELELRPGLTVLTGETGAGKTALLSSLKLLVGERGDAGMVGGHGDEARVEAVFTGIIDTESSEQGRDCSDERLVVRRINAEGRSRCYLDDSLATVGRLAEVFGPSVDLYGQHEHQSLLKASEQLRILDEYGGEGLDTAKQQYQCCLARYREQQIALQELRELSNSTSADREQAAFVLREIEKIAPLEGEYETLEKELPRFQNSEKLAEAASDALELLRGERGTLETLYQAIKGLDELRGIDTTLNDPLTQLETLTIDLEEIVNDIGRYASGIEHDPQVLQDTLDRLGELDGLSRRFGPGMDAVFARKKHSEQLLRGEEDTEECLKKAEVRLREAELELRASAEQLASLRNAVSEEFIVSLNDILAELALIGASLEFSVQELPFEKWNSSGPQSVELLYSPAPDAPVRPLAKIASGGELSRVMLAIKSLLQTNDRAMTLVFDEIDAGIGGKTAHAVAKRLSSLAQRHQVLVITHLAQIAVCADSHFLVAKTGGDSVTQTSISQLDGSARIQEIARMLSGSSDKEALAHARKMLEEAQR